MTYVLSTAKLDATGHRWLAELAFYDFSIIYRPGSDNADADGLSRRPHTSSKKEVILNQDEVKSVCNLATESVQLQSIHIVPTSTDDWCTKQRSDETLYTVIQYVLSGKRPSRKVYKNLSQDVKRLLREFEKF